MNNFSIERTKIIFENILGSKFKNKEKINMKNYLEKPIVYAFIYKKNIISKKFIINEINNKFEYNYDSLEGMLNSGWIIDL